MGAGKSAKKLRGSSAVFFLYSFNPIRGIFHLGIGIRIDHLFGPFYERDLKEGRLTKEEALDILQLLWIKLNELGLVYSPTVSSVYGGVASLQAVTIGERIRTVRT